MCVWPWHHFCSLIKVKRSWLSKRAVMETQLTCFNKKNMIPSLCSTLSQRHRTPSPHLQWHAASPPANRSQCITVLLKFYLLTVKDGDSVRGKTPSVHFNMNGECKFGAAGAAEMWNCVWRVERPRHAGLIQTAFDVRLRVKWAGGPEFTQTHSTGSYIQGGACIYTCCSYHTRKTQESTCADCGSKHRWKTSACVTNCVARKHQWKLNFPVSVSLKSIALFWI